MLPTIVILLWLDHRAHKQNLGATPAATSYDEKIVEVKEDMPKGPWTQRLKQTLLELDAFGLILLGFGWALVSLRCFSLQEANSV